MTIAIAVAFVVLAAAIVLLFSMLGELAARLPDPSNSRASKPWVRPLPDAPIGRHPESWPAMLSYIATADRSLLIALSTACATCEDVAAQLTTEVTDGVPSDFAVIVSSSTTRIGKAFVKRHGLDALPHSIDNGGEWLRSQLGVNISPSAMVFERGRLRSSYLFNDIGNLKTTLASVVQAEESP